MTNKCEKTYRDTVWSRKKYGVLRPGFCSDYKIKEGIELVKKDYFYLPQTIVQNVNRPQKTRQVYKDGLVLGEEIYYLKNIPVELCKVLGWNFTSTFHNLNFCGCVNKNTLSFINTTAKPKIDQLAIIDLERTRLRIMSLPASVLRKELKSGIDSTGLFKTINHVHLIAEQIKQRIP